MSQLIRCFIAVDVKDENVLNKIIRIQNLLPNGSLKLVEKENMHFTLRFLGEIEQSLVETIRNSLKSVSFNPFNIHLKGVGAFPSFHKPRVVWIGVSEGAENLMKLHSTINEILKNLHIRLEEEEFTPHLTIARVKYPNRELPHILNELKDEDFGQIIVKAFQFKQSILTPKGPIYKDLEVYSAVL
ncbi:MAG: RNA 2',3'-cyclic phosphodiesterase [Thermoprotei archaeon]|jgi:2'-5' RNA ligase